MSRSRLINLGDPGKRIQVFDSRSFGVVNHAAIFAEANTGEFFERFAVGIIDDLVSNSRRTTKSMARVRLRISSGSTVTGGPTKQTCSFGFASFIIEAILISTSSPGVEVNSTSSSKSLPISMVCSIEMPCGGASTTLLSGSMPAG